MVVAGRAARRERVAEPEAVLLRRPRWPCRTGAPCPCRPRPPGRGRRRRARARPRGCTTSPPTMLSVMSSMPRISVMYWRRSSCMQRRAVERRALEHEPALRADRHDHRVLDHLRLHQAEDLGAVVLEPVRPADAAARDRARRAGARRPSRASKTKISHSGTGLGISGTSAQRSLNDRCVALGQVRVRAHGRHGSCPGSRAGCGRRRGCDGVQVGRDLVDERRPRPPRRRRRPGRSGARRAAPACARWRRSGRGSRSGSAT